MYFAKKSEYNDIREKSSLQWLDEMEKHDDVAVRCGVKLAREYMQYLKDENEKLRYAYSVFRRRYQRRHTGKPLTNDQNATKQCTLSATLTRDIIITLNYCELNSAG